MTEMKTLKSDNKLRWRRDFRDHANCRDVDGDIFFPVETETHEVNGVTVEEVKEPPYPTPEIKMICGRCVVAPDCLAYALANNIEFGTFAGMTGYQRSLIQTRRPRKRCPGCSSDEIDVLERTEVCVACGISWDRGLLDDEDI